MKALIRFAALSFVVGFYVGCSPMKFAVDSSKCADYSDSCVVTDGKYSFNYSQVAGGGKVDILIVDDNSASMSFEQARLAARFQNFIDDLETRHVDYRIGITTTDVSGGPFPQGGSLIPFASGVPYLTSTTGSSASYRKSLFNATLQRPETLSCESFIANWIASGRTTSTAGYSSAYTSNCPSGDERGVYSANLTVMNNPQSFIRSDANLAIIFLGDEDERSGLYSSMSQYALENYDQPATLVNNIKNQYGSDKYNNTTVHAIVVRDQTCLAVQNSQILGGVAATQGLVSGSIGTVYMALPNAGWGQTADICSTDYSSQLGQIRVAITNKIQNVILACSNPGSLAVTVNGSSVGYNLSGKTLTFTQTPASGATVNVSYTCDSI
jgi:hypothetical protein